MPNLTSTFHKLANEMCTQSLVTMHISHVSLATQPMESANDDITIKTEVNQSRTKQTQIFKFVDF